MCRITRKEYGEYILYPVSPGSWEIIIICSTAQFWYCNHLAKPPHPPPQKKNGICLPHDVEEPRWSNFHTYDRARQEWRWRPYRGSGHLWIAIVLACSDFSSKIQSAKNSLVSLSPLWESFKPRGYGIILPPPSSVPENQFKDLIDAYRSDFTWPTCFWPLRGILVRN